MSLGLAISSGAMGKQAQDQYNKTMVMAFGVLGGICGLGALGYAGYSAYEKAFSEDNKRENQKYVQKGGRRTRKRRT